MAPIGVATMYNQLTLLMMNHGCNLIVSPFNTFQDRFKDFRDVGLSSTLKVYKIFTKVSQGPWLRGDSGVINCTPLSALSFWVNLFPRTRGYNSLSLRFGVWRSILKIFGNHSQVVPLNMAQYPRISNTQIIKSLYIQVNGFIWSISRKNQSSIRVMLEDKLGRSSWFIIEKRIICVGKIMEAV